MVSTRMRVSQNPFLGFVVVLMMMMMIMKPTKSFAPVSQRQRSSGWVATITRRSLLRATIYAPSGGWEDEYCGLDDDGNENSLFSSSPFHSEIEKHSALVSFLSNDHMTALARLAVAFSPPGHALELRDIEHVQVLRVDENHIDIQAVICENDGCVTLAVPVTFPHPCAETTDESDLQECVMGNLGELWEQAETLLRTIEWDQAHDEEVQAGQRERQVLLATHDLQFPDWWARPGTRELTDECQSVRSLLNEDCFQAEIRALTDMALAESDAMISTDDGNTDTGHWTVEQAAVAAVGPAGFLIRAATRRLELFQDTATRKMVEVPIFFGAKADNVSDLRAAVLGAVAAAGDFV